ncbi:putative diguanylate cyclase [Mariprofundus micogutta]|uniref:Putative diguanylate cyclase n=1 Tax=Mariprofundus micogutta TaxID=1921010 RepID=A0A1L8CM37_9PROT|nr:hypothetical protein [Mariprofundus micogutta]GAV19964.1 putative diguanylate cyclase [Mariprofundus micogutta]
MSDYKERLEATLSGTNCGTFSHDFSKNLINIDQRVQLLIGLRKPTVTFEEWVNIIHPEDRSIAFLIQKELENQSPHINVSYRIIKDNNDSYIKVDSFVKYKDKVPLTTYGLVQDITDLMSQKVELEIKNKELESITKQLQAALEEVKVLKGIITICSYCKKIHADDDSWQQIESYIATHSEAQFSHGICPGCRDKPIKELKEWLKKKTY